jgi:hypothetical protein
MPQNQYPHKNLPLTSAVADFLIPKLIGIEPIRRKIIAQKILTHHISNGGIRPTGNFSNVIKRSLQNLNQKGILNNVANGFWKINQANENQATPSTKNQLTEAIEPDESQRCIVEKTIGSGSGSVYIYYYPTYKEKALITQSKHWPCKIGRSDINPIDRVISQVGTALPESPIIALILKTDNSSVLEYAIQGILKLRSRWNRASPGVEWFNTNPEEIEKIFIFINSSSDIHES